jgi:hypothetical protein
VRGGWLQAAEKAVPSPRSLDVLKPRASDLGDRRRKTQARPPATVTPGKADRGGGCHGFAASVLFPLVSSMGNGIYREVVS